MKKCMIVSALGRVPASVIASCEKKGAAEKAVSDVGDAVEAAVDRTVGLVRKAN